MIDGNNGRPTRSAVTGFADIRGIEMPTGQSVTTRTGTRTIHLRVVDGDNGRPTRSAVTGLAHIGGIEMAIG